MIRQDHKLVVRVAPPFILRASVLASAVCHPLRILKHHEVSPPICCIGLDIAGKLYPVGSPGPMLHRSIPRWTLIIISLRIWCQSPEDIRGAGAGNQSCLVTRQMESGTCYFSPQLGQKVCLHVDSCRHDPMKAPPAFSHPAHKRTIIHRALLLARNNGSSDNGQWVKRMWSGAFIAIVELSLLLTFPFHTGPENKLYLTNECGMGQK